MKQSFLFLLLAFFIYGGMASFCLSETDGFSLSKISWNALPIDSTNETKEMAPIHILEQKFYYLQSGGQSFAFVSEDGKYVLKFFKNYLSWPRAFVISSKRQEKLLRKKDRDFYSYRLAFEELQEESGVLYLHLHTTKNLPHITLVDKLGIAHKVRSDTLPFLLQNKGELIYPHLEKLMHRGDVEKAKEALSSLVQLLLARVEKGIFDEDAKIHRNCGFVNNSAIFIDVGRFRKSAEIQTLQKMTNRLKNWLHEHYPELEEHLDHVLKNF